ncbi:hypothetical protein MRX96_037490 [Rhipicephalus microplus]
MPKSGALTLKASRFQWPSLPQLLDRAAIASRRGGDDVDRHGTTAAEPVGETRCPMSAQAPIDPNEPTACLLAAAGTADGGGKRTSPMRPFPFLPQTHRTPSPR